MNYNQNLSEVCAVLGKLDPQSFAAGTTTVGPIQTNISRRLVAIIKVGTIGTSVDAKWTAATTSGGTYTDVTGAAITQITASSKIALLELKSESVESLMGSGYQYVKLSLTGVGTNLVDVVVLGAPARYQPNSTNNIAAVASTTVV